MAFDNLSDKLSAVFKRLRSRGKLTEADVKEAMREVRLALLEADVNYKVAKQFTDTVKEKALGQNVLTSVKPSQLMVKIVHDELAQLMGGTSVDINLDGRPAVILMSGLQGSGKTTTANLIYNILKEIQSPIDISLYVDKDPYIKNITEDKIINITGESGSGKSYYTNKYLNDDDYINYNEEDENINYLYPAYDDIDYKTYDNKYKIVTLEGIKIFLDE